MSRPIRSLWRERSAMRYPFGPVSEMVTSRFREFTYSPIGPIWEFNRRAGQMTTGNAGTPTQPKESGSTMTAVQVREGPLTIAADSPVAGAVWNPFSLMDRLDADALVAEMQGIASDVLVYKIKEGEKETVGLSKQGVDECCTMLVQQGQCIREQTIDHEFIGDGENREALFKCVAARFAVHADGREVRMDQVIGVKREPLYEERAPLTLDSRVPGKRWRDKGTGGKPLTYREAIDESHAANENRGEAIGYLNWIVEQSSFDDATKQFVAAVLAGVDVEEFAAGKRFNPFWYEHGAMKAARNARFRLVPAEVKAAVIALAKQTSREMVKEVERNEARSARSTSAKPSEPSQPRFFRREQNRPAYGWLFAPHVGIPIDAKHAMQATGGGWQPGRDYIIPDNDLQKAQRFAQRGLAGEEVRKGDGSRGVLDADERKTVEGMAAAIEHELIARLDEQNETKEEQRARSESVEDASARKDADPT